MMLRGSLIVHGADLERLARSAIRDAGLRPSWHREEDLLAELIAAAWELSEKHDEHRYPGQFAAGCYRVLHLRVVDWIRRTEGRTRWQFSEEGARQSKRRHTRTVEHEGKRSVAVERSRPTVLSLNAPFGADSDSELGEALASLALDASADRNPALDRALRCRDSEAGRPAEEERRRTTRQASG